MSVCIVVYNVLSISYEVHLSSPSWHGLGGLASQVISSSAHRTYNSVHIALPQIMLHHSTPVYYHARRRRIEGVLLLHDDRVEFVTGVGRDKHGSVTSLDGDMAVKGDGSTCTYAYTTDITPPFSLHSIAHCSATRRSLCSASDARARGCSIARCTRSINGPRIAQIHIRQGLQRCRDWCCFHWRRYRQRTICSVCRVISGHRHDEHACAW